jgi:hypothetical protein
MFSDQIEAKRARERLRYADMTPEQKSSKKALRDSRRNSLSKESNAMENPCWTPELVFNAPGPQGYIPTCDWHIPDFSGTPIYIEPTTEQISREVTPNMEVSNISRRKHVTPGERHTLLGHRNEAFYLNSKKHATALADENPSMTIEGVNGSEWPTQLAIINNGNVHIFIVLLLQFKSLTVVMTILSYCIHRNYVSDVQDCSNTSNALTSQ